MNWTDINRHRVAVGNMNIGDFSSEYPPLPVDESSVRASVPAPPAPGLPDPAGPSPDAVFCHRSGKVTVKGWIFYGRQYPRIDDPLFHMWIFSLFAGFFMLPFFLWSLLLPFLLVYIAHRHWVVRYFLPINVMRAITKNFAFIFPWRSWTISFFFTWFPLLIKYDAL